MSAPFECKRGDRAPVALHVAGWCTRYTGACTRTICAGAIAGGLGHGSDIRHVPDKGVVAAIPDLVGGPATMMFSPIPIVLPLVSYR